MKALVFLAMLAAPGLAAAQDAERGRRLAQQWCSACHTIERTPSSARADGIPSLPAIAATPGMSAERLRAAMNPLHSRMPDLSLAKRDQDDIVSYVLSLPAR